MHDLDLDLNLLVALRALLAERHVTRAAKAIGLSQPAMSHALARLRERLGDPLLVRTAKGMRATARAEAMVGPLEDAWQALGRALAPPPRFDPARATRRFTIATSDYVELVLLPKLCAALWSEAPGVDVRVVFQGTTEAEEALAENGVDLVIGLAPTSPSLRTQVLFHDRLVCVVRDDHPIPKQRRLSLDDFVSLSHALVAPRGTDSRGIVDDVLARLGRRRRIALELPHFLVAPHVVRETDLVLTLAARVARSLAPLLGLRQLAPPIELDGFAMAMTWHEREHADPAHAWFRKTVHRVARAL